MGRRGVKVRDGRRVREWEGVNWEEGCEGERMGEEWV